MVTLSERMRGPEMSSVVFLLGAGASRDAGQPLVADLTKGFRAALEKDPHAGPLLQVFDAAVECRGVGGSSLNIERVLQLLGDVAAVKGAGAAVVDAWAPSFAPSLRELKDLSGIARQYMRRETP